MIPSIDITGLSITQIEQVLDSKNIVRATTSTVNKLAAKVGTDVKKAINTKYLIKQKDLVAKGGSNRNGLRVKRARIGTETAFVLGNGNALPVANFRISPATPDKFRSRKRGSGVTYTVQRGKKVKVKGAFVARMSSGHIGAFIRTSKERTPIRELFGPSIPQMLSETNSLEIVQRTLNESGPKIYEHELRFRLASVFK